MSNKTEHNELEASTADEIIKEIKVILGKQTGKEIQEIEGKTFQDLGLDSLDTVEILMQLEDAFGIDIPDEAVTTFKNVGDVVEYVKTKKVA